MEGFYFSVNRSTVLAAEVIAMAKVLWKWESKGQMKNIIIYSDSNSAIMAISNNGLSVYKN